MHIYDIAIVGGGAAGSMAAIRASGFSKNIVLVERNASVGRKILLTGKGRCNITNVAPMDTFIEKFGPNGNFFRSAFSAFSNKDLMDFFQSQGLKLKSERQGRVFPVTDRARSVIDTLRNCLEEAKIDILYKTTLSNMQKKEGFFELYLSGSKKICAKKVILAMGGLSYGETGSRGDGFRVARRLGHTVMPLKAALVPLKTRETWVKELQGLSLKNVRVTFRTEKKKIVSNIGELMFTHFGISGPLVLDLSGEVVELLSEHKEIRLNIDLKPALDAATLKTRLINEFKRNANSGLSSVMQNLLPKKMTRVFLRLAGLDSAKIANQVTQGERHAIIDLLKALPLTVAEALSIKRGMVTNGGVSTKEIDPRTMESRLLPGLYFAGEMIDGSAPSGGYNLQQAFSTGFLAGEGASRA